MDGEEPLVAALNILRELTEDQRADNEPREGRAFEQREARAAPSAPRGVRGVRKRRGKEDRVAAAEGAADCGDEQPPHRDRGAAHYGTQEQHGEHGARRQRLRGVRNNEAHLPTAAVRNETHYPNAYDGGDAVRERHDRPHVRGPRRHLCIVAPNGPRRVRSAAATVLRVHISAQQLLHALQERVQVRRGQDEVTKHGEKHPTWLRSCSAFHQVPQQLHDYQFTTELKRRMIGEIWFPVDNNGTRKNSSFSCEKVCYDS